MFGGRFLPGLVCVGLGPPNALRPETAAPATATPVAARNFLRDRAKGRALPGRLLSSATISSRRAPPLLLAPRSKDRPSIPQSLSTLAGTGRLAQGGSHVPGGRHQDRHLHRRGRRCGPGPGGRRAREGTAPGRERLHRLRPRGAQRAGHLLGQTERHGAEEHHQSPRQLRGDRLGSRMVRSSLSPRAWGT